MKKLAVAFTCLSLVTCSPKPPELGPNGGNTRTVAEETGRQTVLAVSGPTTPLIVDWAPEHRADLEETMANGVAVVAFDSKGLRLLTSCRIQGKYGFVGVTTKFQTVQLENTEEVRANLPLGGISLIAKVGAEFGHGETLDVAMAMVGKRRTTWRDVVKSDLEGSCAGATHFVRGATIGAFVLETGSRAEGKAGAEVLGAGAEYKKGKAKKVHNSDGSLDACKLASPDVDTPPAQCRALIRLELDPILVAPKEKKTPAAPAERQAEPTLAAECPSGMVMTEGKCAAPASAKSHLCRYGDADECKAQCELGSADSCNNLGVMAFRGDGVKADLALADTMFQKGCNAGNADACVNVAVRLYNGDPGQSAVFANKGCAEGNALGCEIVGEHLHFGQGVQKDVLKAFKYYKLACDGGDQSGCTNVGVLLAGAASEIPKDEAAGIQYTQRACDGGVSTACGNLGLKYEFGVVVKKDAKKAVDLFARACRMSAGGDCLRLGIAYQAGFGLKKDDTQARDLYTRACGEAGTSFGAVGCSMLNLAYGGKHTIPPEAVDRLAQVMQPQCEQDVPRACTFLGVAQLASGKKSSGEMFLNAGCKMKDYWACDLKKRLRIK